MNLQNVVPVGQNDYVVETSKDLVALSSIARIGSRVLCLEDNKVYVYMDVNKWETALDLAGGPSNATRWVGVTTTALTDGATTDPVVINGENVAAELGAMVSYGPDEFVWNGNVWQKFGGDSETFRVTVNNNNTADRTFVDTLAAFNAGKFVYAIRGSDLYLVSYGSNNLIAFYKFGVNNVTFSSSPGAVNRVQRGFALRNNDTIVEQNEFVLPQITTSDNGKLLGVNNGSWTKVDGFPSISNADEGKAFSVSSGVAGWNSKAVPAVPESVSIAAILKANDLGELSWENTPYIVDVDTIVASDGTTTLTQAIQAQLATWLTAAAQAPGTFTAIEGSYDFYSGDANLSTKLSNLFDAVKPVLLIDAGGVTLIPVPNFIYGSVTGLIGMYFHVGGTVAVSNTNYYVNGDVWVSFNGVGISGFAMPTTMTQAPTLSGSYTSGTNTLNITGGA